MSLLDQIFKKLQYPKNRTAEDNLSEKIEFTDVLFDWFSDAKIDFADFKKDFLDPCMKLKIEGQPDYFENYPEQAYERYFNKFTILYIASKYPDLNHFQKFFEFLIAPNSYRPYVEYEIDSDVVRTFQDSPEIMKILSLGAYFLKSYHSIYVQKDTRLSDVESILSSLKYDTDDTRFVPVFNFINEAQFEGKLLLFYKASMQIPWRRENEEAKFQPFLEQALIQEIKLHNDNSENTFKIKKSIFDDLQDSLFAIKKNESYKNTDYKKVKFLPLKNFPKVLDLLEKYKDNSMSLIEHLVYIINRIDVKYELIYDANKLYKEFFAHLTSNRIYPEVWFLQLLTYETQSDFLITHIYHPIFKNMVEQLHFEAPIVIAFEKKILSNIGLHATPIKQQKSLDLLLNCYQKIENDAQRRIHISKYKGVYLNQEYENNFYLTLSDNKTNQKEVQQIAEKLKPIFPVSIKSISRNNFNVDDAITLFTLNIDGQDYPFTSYFVNEINKILSEKITGYQAVPIPLYFYEKQDYYKREVTGHYFSLTFMNYEEFTFFQDTYIPYNFTEFIDNELYSSVNYTKEDAPSILELSTKTNENQHLFLDDTSWNWFKDQYVDTLRSKAQWYDIMAQFIGVKGAKKPNKTWLKSIQKSINEFGQEQFFKELNVLITSSIKEKFWFLEAYRNTLKAVIWTCGIYPTDTSYSIVKSIVESAYTKISGVGPKSATIGNVGLELFATSGHELGFGMMNLMRNKSKYPRFIKVLDKYVSKFEENTDIPTETLADRSIPNFGFENGEKSIPISEKFQVTFEFKNQKLVKKWGVDGKSLSKIPDEIKTDYPEVLKEINHEAKQITTIFKDLKFRIETYWLYDRKWNSNDWLKDIYEHSLLHIWNQNLVWTNETQEYSFMILGTEFRDVNFNLVELKPDDEISLWHPMTASESEITQWQTFALNKKIVQPLRQIYREHYPFSATELTMEQSPRFSHHFLKVNKLMAIANSASWIFTYAHDSESYPRKYIKPLDITVHQKCDYCPADEYIPSKNLFFTKGNTINLDYPSKYEHLTFEQIPLKTLSELCRDIDLFIATSSIANDPKLSVKSEQNKHYRDEFRAGLFSDNASAKMRKQILTQLIPILKINSSGFEGNYLIVDGKLNSYRINLGSGFAQIKGSQKHINLLPDISPMKKSAKIHIPIQDDETLYIILAKAIFLQKDDKITDQKLVHAITNF